MARGQLCLSSIWVCLSYGELKWLNKELGLNKGETGLIGSCLSLWKELCCVLCESVWWGDQTLSQREWWGGQRDLCSASLQTFGGSRTLSSSVATKMHGKPEFLCSFQYCATTDMSVPKVTRLEPSSLCLHVMANLDVIWRRKTDGTSVCVVSEQTVLKV